MDKQSDTSGKIFPLNHMAAIGVVGADNAKFLQGQLTCDINALSDSRASIAAFCNPKGRVISTMLIVKTNDSFLLILPSSLLDKVLKKLQMYILRSAVTLNDQSQNFQLFGLSCSPAEANQQNLPAEDFSASRDETDTIFICLPAPSPRYLCIGKQPESPATPAQRGGFDIADSAEWRYQDISCGLPWFDLDQSELYIPQMLNIDGLGGISFNKGCYTGQEIIARTHYLGKAKRNLFLAECEACAQTPEAGMAVLNNETKQSVASVLSAQTYSESTRILLVLQVADAESHTLVLDDAKQTAIKIVPIQ